MFIKTVKVSPNYYVGFTTLAGIQSNCPDPMRVALSTEKDRKADTNLDRAFHARGVNQRDFNAARIRRAEAYARYIAHVRDGGLGGYPPVTLWTERDLPWVDGVLEYPGVTVFSANDGETQLAARYMLAKADPAWLDVPFAITITTNSTKEAAQQTLHDMNHYATPVSEKETSALNVEGPLTKAINLGIAQSGRDAGLSIKPRTEKVTGTYLTTNLILLHGAIGALHGADSLTRTPNALIKRANAQFGDLGVGAHLVTGFVAEVLRLPDDLLRAIGSDQMLALGAKYNTLRRVPAPLGKDLYLAIDAELKAANGGKRATINGRAIGIVTRLAA